MQTTLLGLTIAFILALIAALIGPYFIDWNQFRPQFEAEASKVIGAPVRVAGKLDARLLPTPTLRLRSIVVGGADDLGRVRADKLDVEFSLGDLMRGQWRASQLNVEGLALDLGLDPQGRVDWPAWNGTFNFASLSIDRLSLTGRVALHDAASRSTLELNDIAFSGDVRSLAGSLRGGGQFTVEGTRYPFRVSSSQSPGNNGTRVHLAIDPAERPLSIDLDGQLSFAARAPRFDGTLVLATPPPKKGSEHASTPWRVVTKLKADHAAAQLEQIEASYGEEDRALKLTGLGDVRFGASPLLHATLSARQLDADRFLAGHGATDSQENNGGGGEAPRLLAALQTLTTQLPRTPIRTRIEAGAEQIMLGGRPLQNVSLALRSDTSSWAVERLDLRAPGTTQISFTRSTKSVPSGGLAGTLDIDSADPDVLAAWLQGRSDAARRTQKPFRLVGDVTASKDRIAIDALNAEIDGSAVEGRVALTAPRPPRGTRLEASLKAESLDFDAVSAFVRSVAGPDIAWPDEASVSLDVGRALSAGQELKPFAAKFGYDAKMLRLDQLKFGEAGGATVEGSGSFDRRAATGHLAFSANSASLRQLTAMIAPLAPSLASRMEAAATAPGPAHLKFQLDLGKNTAKATLADARATLELNAPQLNGTATVAAEPEVASLRAFDLDALGHSQLKIDTKLSAERGATLLALLGLDRTVGAADGRLQFEGSARGVWHQALRLSARMWGGGIDADALGTIEPWGGAPKGDVSLKVRSINLGPMFGLDPSDTLAQNIRLFAHASLAGDKLTLDGIDSVAGGSRLRGHLVVSLGDQRSVDGEVGLDRLDLASAFELAIGAAGHDPAEPLDSGLLKGWHGRVAFEALRGSLPGGAELLPVSGAIKSDGQSLTFESLKGKIGGGDVTATIDARPDPNGILINSRLDLSDVDSSALHYRGMKMPSGRASLQMTLMSRGRSVAALAGAMSGSGTLTLKSASIPGLDPRAFDVAIRASDAGKPTDDNHLRQIVGPVLAAGSLPVATAQIPFNIHDGRLRIDATTLESSNAHVIVSGGYDMPADQADIRLSFSANSIGSASSRPEIQILATGTPDALNSTLDVTSLSSWLAVRTIDRETKRLDAFERGEPPPAESAPPATAALPLPVPPEVTRPNSSGPEARPPGHDPRHPPSKPVAAPRASASPLMSQQASPLPPPIEVKPAPGPAPARLKPAPRPPLVLTPQAAHP